MPESEDSSRIRSRHTSSDASKESSEYSSDVSLPAPPDGGWGWVVVFSSFMVHLIADGCSFSFGVLYTELLQYFQESKGKTAWVGSLFVSVPLITGPIASAMTNRYGARFTTMLGGFTAATGFLLSSGAQSIEVLCLTFGLVAGLGLSMVYVPAVVIVAYYFEEKRAFATGLAVAGSGIGTFVFAPLTEFLIDVYTWRGAVIIIGGIMLNMMVCGAVFRPLLGMPSQRRKAKSKQSFEKISHNASKQSFAEYRHCNGHEPNPCLPAEIDALLQERMTHSLMQFPTYLQNELTAMAPDILQDLSRSGNKTLQEVLLERDLLDKFYASHSLQDVASAGNDNVWKTDSEVPTTSSCLNSSSDKQLCTVQQSVRDVWQKPHHPRPHRSKLLPDQFLPINRKDIFYRGNLLRPGILSRGMSASCPDIIMRGADPNHENVHRCCSPVRLTQFSKEVKHTIRKMLDLSILKNILFVYFTISGMILYMWYDVPYVYTVDKAIKMGIKEEHASFLVSIIGIVSTVGQIVIGFLGDREKVNAVLLYCGLTSAAGLVTMLVPLLKGYAWLALYCAAFGFLISANYALTTIILVDLLGMEKLTNAYGLTMLAQGVVNLIGPPLAGWISDKTGNYDAAFYTAGSGILVSGIMLIAIPFLRPPELGNVTTATLSNDSTSHSDVQETGPSLARNSAQEMLLVELQETSV